MSKDEKLGTCPNGPTPHYKVDCIRPADWREQPAPGEPSRCPMCESELESYTINGGVWLGEGKGFDTTPKTEKACPKCDNQQ